MRRQLKDASVFFFFNESDRAFAHSATLMGVGKKAEVWDPQTGTVQPLHAIHPKPKGSLKIDLSLKPYETEVVVVR